MHELSIAADIIKIVEDAASGADIKRVDIIEIEIGELSGVEIEALKMAMDISTKGTVAANAELNIEIIKGEGHCLECGKDTPVSDLYSGCPSCGSFRLDITKGMEKRVKSIYTND
jgi:hydrogenase nickel incorporation protein HypA/HybF